MWTLDDLYEQVHSHRMFGEEVNLQDVLDDLPVDDTIRLLAQAEQKASEWRQVKTVLTQHLADELAGRKIRYGQTLYRSRRKTVREIPADLRTEFAEWVAEGGAQRIARLFNPNTVRFGQLRDEKRVDYDTGEIMSAFNEFVTEIAEDVWMLEALPASRWPAYAENMPEGQVQ